MGRVMLGHGNLATLAETGLSSIVSETSMSAASKCLWLTARAHIQILWEPFTKESGDMTCSTVEEQKSVLIQIASSRELSLTG